MAFVKLPLEINELIASFLADDNDLCLFTLVCRHTHAAVHSHHCTIWRDRFDANFDLPPGKGGFALKKEYQIRQKALRQGYTGLLTGDLPEEKCFIYVLRNLIVESFANDRQDSSGESVSYNLRHLNGLVRRSYLLDYDTRCIGISRRFAHTIVVLRLLCSHLALDSSVTYSFGLTHTTQQTLFKNNVLCSLFRNRMTTINIFLLVHIVNFFRTHLKNESRSEIFDKFKDLAEDEKPNVWQGPLKQGTGKLGRSWKGTYAYLNDDEDMYTVRIKRSDYNIRYPLFDYGQDFQTLELDFAPAECVPWPQVFEDHLHSIPQSSSLEHSPNQHEGEIERAEEMHHWEPVDEEGEIERAEEMHRWETVDEVRSPFGAPTLAKAEQGRDFLPFIGTGVDGRPFRCSGIVHVMPKVQGIPGWQRITFMKYFTNESPASQTDPCYPPFYDIHEDSPHWAYEGVVLPGGHMLLGRWWNPMEPPEERECTGPFIFWNVPDKE